LKKTNAMRLLDAAGVRYAAREYDISDGAISGVAVAAKMGQAAETVFKTLVAEGKNTGLNVFVIPCDTELDLKKAAAATGDKNIEMIKARDLEPKTGYIHGGCSPIGMKKPLPTFIDETAMLFDAIFVSGGKIGLQIEIAPDDLIRMTDAALCYLSGA
jgi:Cys-tRNA(Pro)/Cys-tRNA(Cys) deacylase